MGPLAIAGIVLGGLLLAVLVLLAIPVDVLVRVDSEGPVPVQAWLGLFAGHWRIQLAGREPTPRVPEPEAPDREPEPEPVEPERMPEREPGREAEPVERQEGLTTLDQARIGLAVLRTEGFVKHTVRWIRRIVTSFSVRTLSIRLVFGTGDPADTGRVYGRMQTVLPTARTLTPVDVSVTPDFDRDVFAANGQLALRASPLRLVWVTFRYVVSPTTYRAARAGWRAQP